MKKYIKSFNDKSCNYIGGKLTDIVSKYGYYDDSEESEQIWNDRYTAQNKCISDFTTGYYIVYRPDSNSHLFELTNNYPGLLADISDGMAIKEGIDVCNQGSDIMIIGYYGSYRDTVYLYPINTNKATELGELIDNADFSESVVIDNEIAQESWAGASIEDVLKSWA